MELNKKTVELVVAILMIAYVVLEPDLLPLIGWDDGVAGMIAAHLLREYL